MDNYISNFYAEKDEKIIRSEMIKCVAKLIKEFSSKVFHEGKKNDLLSSTLIYPRSSNEKFSKEKDIKNVGFNSNSLYESVLKRSKELKFFYINNLK
jgi:isoleucyl-tRNA synthetase